MVETEVKVPAIKLFLSGDFNGAEILRELLYGAEEEGVPCQVEQQSSSGTAVQLSYQAALGSVLGVGIGIDGNGVVALHFQKLKEDAPLFSLNYRLDSDKVRNLSSNAARLVKGIPFIL